MYLHIKPLRNRTATNTVNRENFFVGQKVMVCNLCPGLQWIPGTIIERKGPLNYLVQVAGGCIWKRNVDHLQETTDTPQDQTSLVLPAADPTAEHGNAKDAPFLI